MYLRKDYLYLISLDHSYSFTNLSIDKQFNYKN